MYRESISNKYYAGILNVVQILFIVSDVVKLLPDSITLKVVGPIAIFSLNWS